MLSGMVPTSHVQNAEFNLQHYETLDKDKNNVDDAGVTHFNPEQNRAQASMEYGVRHGMTC